MIHSADSLAAHVRPLRAVTDYDEALTYLRRGRRGDRERAEPLLDQAVAQFRAIGTPGWERYAQRLLASEKNARSILQVLR